MFAKDEIEFCAKGLPSTRHHTPWIRVSWGATTDRRRLEKESERVNEREGNIYIHIVFRTRIVQIVSTDARALLLLLSSTFHPPGRAIKGRRNAQSRSAAGYADG